MSSHGQINVFRGGHDTSTAMRSHGKLNVFTGVHDTSTAMSSHGKIKYLQWVITLVMQLAAMEIKCLKRGS
jgi:hypothetical protein